MKAKTIISWASLLIIIDQAIKIVINTFFLETRFEIIPSLFEFKPVFNIHHSYFNSLLYNKYQINIGLLPHIILFLFAGVIMFMLYNILKKNISNNAKLLDIAIIFALAGFFCGLSGNLIWKKGTLDYIYLKPLFVFDLKDIYINCFAVLFLVYFLKNKPQIDAIKTKDTISYVKNMFNKSTRK